MILSNKVNYKRAIVEYLIIKAKAEVAVKGRDIQTIDPILSAGRRLFPYMSEKDLIEFACIALRRILYDRDSNLLQTTLLK